MEDGARSSRMNRVRCSASSAVFGRAQFQLDGTPGLQHIYVDLASDLGRQIKEAERVRLIGHLHSA